MIKKGILKAYIIPLALLGFIISNFSALVGLQFEKVAISYFYKSFEAQGSKGVDFLHFLLLFSIGLLLELLQIFKNPVFTYFLTRGTHESGNRVREMVLGRISTLSPKQLSNEQTTKEMINLIVDDSYNYVNAKLHSIILPSLFTIELLTNLLFILINNWIFALFLILFAPLSFFFIKLLYKLEERYLLSVREGRKDLREGLKRGLDSFSSLFSFGAERLVESEVRPRLKVVNDLEIDYNLLKRKWSLLERFTVGSARSITIAALLLVLVRSSGEGAADSFGNLLTFPLVVDRIYWTLRGYQDSYSHWRNTKLYAQKIEALPKSDLEGEVVSLEAKPTILINNLCFSYGEKQVLRKLSLEFLPGKRYAIIGRSGCGKTTLVKLLLGYFKDYEGSIKINGLEYKDLHPQIIWENISHSDNSNFIFLTSLRENITLFGDDEVSQRVLKKASLEPDELPSDEVDDFALKNYSDGQKQRINLARNFFREKPIVIIDEGLANLDTERVSKIKEEIVKEGRERTYIIISHSIDLSDDFYDEIIDLEEIGKS